MAMWDAAHRKHLSEAMSRCQRGPRNHRWKGGRLVHSKGYIMLLRPGHPRANRNGYVMEHLLVVEEIIGRPVRVGESVHHLNRDRADNRPENLLLFADHGLHMQIVHAYAISEWGFDREGIIFDGPKTKRIIEHFEGIEGL